ncbi:hypothetical protein E8E11_010788 [Didymella keratinophila]|nr:hypothetical protein E8E11_010788 [Didymella keratinophila]
MHVDASDVPASSILAIVATLASVALLSFSLRVYTRGRLLRSLGTDDWLLSVATLCIVGVLVLVVVLSAGEQAWPTATKSQKTSLLLWTITLFHTLGIGFIKLSVTLSVLRRNIRSWHRHTLLVYICFTTVLTVFWFGSALLFAGPITVDWSSTREPEALWPLLHFVNSILDLLTTIAVALLPLPLLWVLHFGLSRKITLAVVYTSIIAVIAAASARTYFLSDPWQNVKSDGIKPLTLICSSIELTLGTTAASLLTLPTFLSSSNHRLSIQRSSKTLSTSTSASPPRYPSNTYASTDTVIRRPSASYAPTLRYHDDESNLDFDMETPNRTRTNTMRSRGTHTRNVSDWSQFSGFTYYTTPVNSGPTSPRRSRVASMNEMETRTRTIAVGKAADETNIGIAVTPLHNKSVRGSEAGEEMAELARLFADKGRDWGAETPREVSRSRRISVTTQETRVSRHKPDHTDTVEKNGHEFVYHRELFGPDQYELSGSGRRDVPVQQAREVEDVEGHCDRICGKLDGTRTVKSQCSGKVCKAQWFEVPDLLV